jgi:small nuclear ribonucleoprotein E
MNTVLDEAEEINLKKNTRKKIGRIILKGDNISLICNIRYDNTTTLIKICQSNYTYSD